MTAPEEFKVDTSRWRPGGPWWDEPHRVDFVTKVGLPGLLLRHPRMGHWCGYVAVPPGHPQHGRGYDDVRRPDGEWPDVHGGLTYADKCNGHVCHVPAPGEPDDVWWFGFDAAHSGDLGPNDYSSPLGRSFFEAASRSDIYRDAHYMRAECERLAEQLMPPQLDDSTVAL